MLQEKQVLQYKKDGFLVIPNYTNSKCIQSLRKEATAIINEFKPIYRTIFTTKNQTDFVNQYFLESGDKVRCFFEEEAFDKEGNLTTTKELSINKIGHALHDINPVFLKFSYQQSLLDIALAIGFEDPIMVQSMYICKQPKIGGAVEKHQDSTFIFTNPHSCVGFWVALEDATVDNGCLWGIPGSHREYVNKKRYIRKKGSYTTEFLGEWEEWDNDKLVPIEVKAGDLVIFDGNFVHSSQENRSEKSRHAYVMHLIEGNCDYPSDNWLQRALDFPFQKMKQVVS